jgi:hypothetical protein
MSFGWRSSSRKNITTHTLLFVRAAETLYTWNFLYLCHVLFMRGKTPSGHILAPCANVSSPSLQRFFITYMAQVLVIHRPPVRYTLGLIQMVNPPDVEVNLLQSCTTDREYRILLTLSVLLALMVHFALDGCFKRGSRPLARDDLRVVGRNNLAARLREPPRRSQ